jgi:hypothetical protein
MESELIDKVEDNRLIKSRKKNKISVIIWMILLFLQIYIGTSRDVPGIVCYCINILLAIVTLIQYLNDGRKIRTGLGMPFIEWWADKVVYRSKKESENHVVLNDNIISIKIKMDEINVYAAENKDYLINLDEYPDYNQRVTIKANFEKLSNKIKTILA